MRARIRKNDTVMVIAGRERGKTGKVLRVLPEKDRVSIERLNMVKRHRSRAGRRAAAASSRRKRRSTSRTSCSCATSATRRCAWASAARGRPQRARLPPLRRAAGHGDAWRRACANAIAQDVVPALMKELGYKNVIPGAAAREDRAQHGPRRGDPERQGASTRRSTELTAITGQKPVVTKAKKAIANFKLREGMPIGCMVTLRGERMYEFLDRLVNVALPRVRDFKGVSDRAFDGRGNYSLGVREQIIFPEIDLDKVDKVRGLTVSICHDREDRRRGQGAAAGARHAVPRLGGRSWRRPVLRIKAQRPPKFKVRGYNRCPLCGRPRAFFRRFQHVPALPARPGAQGADSRPDQGELVRTPSCR